MPKKRVLHEREVVLTDVPFARSGGYKARANEISQINANGKKAYEEKLREANEWNLALAMASGTELKLIRIKHKLYPLGLIDKIDNAILVEFDDGHFMLCPGQITKNGRRDFIGPRFSRITNYYVIPMDESLKKSYQKLKRTYRDAYDYLDAIINKKEYGRITKKHLEISESLIRRAAVVV